MIFKLFIEGKTPLAIAKRLEKEGILSPGGKKKWQVATVQSILSNEKYKGDALLQKTYTVDFLTKTIKTNEGELLQYYVQNSHPAIIDRVEFDAVQAEIERRKRLGRPLSCESALSAKLVCGQCVGYYGPKVWGSNSKYRQVIWRCNEKHRGESKCVTPHVTEEEVKQKFLEAFNSLAGDRQEIVANCRLARETLCNCGKIGAELGELHREIEVVAELSRKAIHENAQMAIGQAEWHERNNGYLERHRKAIERATELEDLMRERQSKTLVLEGFDDRLWLAAVDKAVVGADGEIVFVLKDGTNTTG